MCEEEKEMAKMDSLDTFIGFVNEYSRNDSFGSFSGRREYSKYK